MYLYQSRWWFRTVSHSCLRRPRVRYSSTQPTRLINTHGTTCLYNILIVPSGYIYIKLFFSSLCYIYIKLFFSSVIFISSCFSSYRSVVTRWSLISSLDGTQIHYLVKHLKVLTTTMKIMTRFFLTDRDIYDHNNYNTWLMNKELNMTFCILYWYVNITKNTGHPSSLYFCLTLIKVHHSDRPGMKMCLNLDVSHTLKVLILKHNLMRIYKYIRYSIEFYQENKFWS